MIDTVVISKAAKKSLRTCPRHVVVKLAHWVEQVEDLGLAEVRKIPGFRDPTTMETDQYGTEEESENPRAS